MAANPRVCGQILTIRRPLKVALFVIGERGMDSDKPWSRQGMPLVRIVAGGAHRNAIPLEPRPSNCMVWVLNELSSFNGGSSLWQPLQSVCGWPAPMLCGFAASACAREFCISHNTTASQRANLLSRLSISKDHDHLRHSDFFVELMLLGFGCQRIGIFELDSQMIVKFVI